MSLERGLSAIRLEMPDRIPHTEYLSNPDVISRVTGIPRDDPEWNAKAMREFVRIDDYDFIWRTDVPSSFTNTPRAWMGSARFSDTQELEQASYPFRTVEEVLAFDPVEHIGIPDKETLKVEFTRNVKATQEAFPGVVVPTGYYNTVFTWNIVSFGWELFMEAATTEPRRFNHVMDRFFEITKPIFEAGAEMDVPCFLCHDDIVWASGPVFRPEWYRQYVFPRMKKLWDPIREAGKPILFCSDGNFDEFVDDLVDCGANGFIFEPLTDLSKVAERYGKTHVIIGNVDVRVLMYGSHDDIYAEVKRCADIGRDLPGYFFAVGNHIPYNVPVENALYYFQVRDELSQR